MSKIKYPVCVALSPDVPEEEADADTMQVILDATGRALEPDEIADAMNAFVVSETSQITTSSDHYRNGWNEAIDRAILICEGHDRVIAVKELRALRVP